MILSPVVTGTVVTESCSDPWLQVLCAGIVTTSCVPPAFLTSMVVFPSFGNTSEAATAVNVGFSPVSAAFCTVNVAILPSLFQDPFEHLGHRRDDRMTNLVHGLFHERL